MSESNCFKLSVDHGLSQISDLDTCANIFSIVAFFLLTVLMDDMLAIFFIIHSYNIVIFVDHSIKLKIILNATIIYYVKIDYMTSEVANLLNIKDCCDFKWKVKS